MLVSKIGCYKKDNLFSANYQYYLILEVLIMKKAISILLISIFLATALIACGGGGGGYKDGTYKATYDDFDEHGWKAYVEIVISDGEISDVDFDYVNEDGDIKSEDEEYNALMKEKSGSSPEEFSPALEQQLIEKQNVKEIDNITGATHSVENFKKLAEAALKNAKSGNTEEAIIKQETSESKED